MLKGCEQEVGKLLLAVVKFSTGFNLIKDVTVEEEEDITGVIQWLAILGLYFLQSHLVVKSRLFWRHSSKWINDLQVLNRNCFSTVLLVVKE